MTYLEEGVALLPSSLGLCGVDVSLLVCFKLGLLGVSQFGQDVGGSVFSQGFVEEFDSLLEITKFLVSGSYSAERPGCQL